MEENVEAWQAVLESDANLKGAPIRTDGPLDFPSVYVLDYLLQNVSGPATE